MPRKKKEVEAALRAKGFVQDDSHHRFFVYFAKDGRKTTARTKTSHGAKMKDVPDNILSQMAKQCKLTKAQFLNLVDCPLDRDGLEEILEEAGELERGDANDETSS